MCASKNAPVTLPQASDIGVIWRAAIDRYESNTMTQVDFLPSATSVDDLVDALSDKESSFKKFRHNGSKSDKFRMVLTKFMKRINFVSDVVAQAAVNASPPSVAIFIALRFFMGAIGSVSADYDKIIEFFEDVDSYLSRLQVLNLGEMDMSNIPELKDILIKVLVSVLDILGISAKYIKMKRIAKAFRALTLGEDDELAAAYTRFHKAVDSEAGIIRNATLAMVNQHSKATAHSSRILEEKTDRVEKLLLGREAADERDKILEALSTRSFHEKQRDTFEKRSEATGQWILESTEFQQWFKGNQTSTLWCYGDPGAGKSVFTSIAVNYVNDATQATKTAIVYLYIDHNDPTTHSELGLIASICRQMVEQIYPVPPTVRDFLEKNAARKRNPSEDEWTSLVISLRSLFSDTYIFVDALDECPTRNRHKFLQSMKRLEGSVRFLFTSRPFIDDVAQFGNLVRLKISASDSDVETYLEFEINNDTRLWKLLAKDGGLKDKIIQLVKSNADGMFLLASLQMDLLRGHNNLRKVRAAMDTLSPDVYETYHATMQRIKSRGPQDYELARKALSYIFCAKRPLDIEELRHALGIEVEDSMLDEDALPDKDILLEVSIGLIRIDEQSGIIGLVHHTLHEFFAQYPEQLVPDPDGELARLCLTYLSFDNFESGPSFDGDTLSRRLQEFRLLDYASHHWGRHFQRQLPEQLESILEFLDQSKKLASSVQVLHVTRYRTKDWFTRYPKNFRPSHVVAYWGLEKVLELLLENDFDIDAKDSYGATPLIIAAENGHVEVLRILLDKGASINAVNYRGESALYWAARNGHKAALEFLLEKGADLIKDDEEWSALNWLIVNGDVELTKVLLSSSVELDTDGDGINEALNLAAEEGKEAIVQILLDHGANINAQDWVGSTALDFASTVGHEATVQVLLQNGANVNSKDKYGNSALHWAVSFEGVVRMLLEKGSDVDAKNDIGQTPLIWSAQSGSPTVTAILLDHNADVNLQDVAGLTPLHKAVLGGFESIVQLLLKHGADPKMKDEDGWTPLHCAVVKKHDDLVQLLKVRVEDGQSTVDSLTSQLHDAKNKAILTRLADKKAQGSTALTGLRYAAQEGQVGRIQSMLEKGADINASDAGGFTALELAVFQGQMKAAEVLLENGADPNKRGSDEKLPLAWAIEGNNESMVRLLIEHGANVHTSIDGFTFMHLAVDFGNIAIVQSLIDAGADIQAKDQSGQAAIHTAAVNGRDKIALVLIEAGANINDLDSRGRTPLILATENLQHKVVKFFLERGASLAIKSQDGHSALDVAKIRDDKDIVHLFIKSELDSHDSVQNALDGLSISDPVSSNDCLKNE